ncbi:hypothetical protein GCM10007092_05300 [Thermus composti]|uniref:Uncharacterized protein n=1 Tax=Thermus composti TaxID=532059 RepID=A0ABV6Q3I0_9DEIN|nr:hypothetical protein [Thermus composti]GGM94859.1 hypothetical protein GCM10007092_05300 [Thermus composti]
MRFRRVQVVLEEAEWAKVKRLAWRLRLARGRPVSAQEVLRELVTRGLREEARPKEAYQEVLEALRLLGEEAVEGRDFLEEDRQAHDERLGA